MVEINVNKKAITISTISLFIAIFSLLLGLVMVSFVMVREYLSPDTSKPKKIFLGKQGLPGYRGEQGDIGQTGPMGNTGFSNFTHYYSGLYENTSQYDNSEDQIILGFDVNTSTPTSSILYVGGSYLLVGSSQEKKEEVLSVSLGKDLTFIPGSSVAFEVGIPTNSFGTQYFSVPLTTQLDTTNNGQPMYYLYQSPGVVEVLDETLDFGYVYIYTMLGSYTDNTGRQYDNVLLRSAVETSSSMFC